eukprot:2249150-Rhodomonas_salina.4
MWKKLQKGLIELGKGEPEQLRKVFDRIDRNGDGYVPNLGLSFAFRRAVQCGALLVDATTFAY